MHRGLEIYLTFSGLKHKIIYIYSQCQYFGRSLTRIIEILMLHVITCRYTCESLSVQSVIVQMASRVSYFLTFTIKS